MPPHIRASLTPSQASHICMNQCRAHCCRGPWVLSLTPAEVRDLESGAAELGVPLEVRRGQNGGGQLRFADHPGDRCPMLDPQTFACRIYPRRPQRCRSFPERPTPGCAISAD